jgi:hypothetical protein
MPGQHLQSHVPVERGVASLIDLSDAPLANEGGDVVIPEAGASG